MARYVHQFTAESHRNQERAGIVRISAELAYTRAEGTERKCLDYRAGSRSVAAP